MRAQADMFRAPSETEEDKNERYTLPSTFDPLHAEFGFTLDVCATAESAKCPRFYTKAADGLKQSWAGEMVWCNPPWDDIEAWVGKAWAEKEARGAFLLVPTRTDRGWWQRLVEPFRDNGGRLRTRFLPGRHSFGSPGDPGGLNAADPNFWLVGLIWRRTT